MEHFDWTKPGLWLGLTVEPSKTGGSEGSGNTYQFKNVFLHLLATISTSKTNITTLYLSKQINKVFYLHWMHQGGEP